MDAERCEPARAWHAFDRWHPPHARPDKRSTWDEIDHLARADAAHGVHAGVDEEGKMGVRTQTPIGHQHISGSSHGVHLLYLGEIMGEEGCDHPRQEHPSAGMEEP
jgi:hypothetical protein